MWGHCCHRPWRGYLIAQSRPLEYQGMVLGFFLLVPTPPMSLPISSLSSTLLHPIGMFHSMHTMILVDNALLLQLPPPAEKITTLVHQTFFLVITDFRLPIFPVMAPTYSPRIASCNRFTNISSKPCWSPIHIVSRHAETWPNFQVIPWNSLPRNCFR